MQVISLKAPCPLNLPSSACHPGKGPIAEKTVKSNFLEKMYFLKGSLMYLRRIESSCLVYWDKRSVFVHPAFFSLHLLNTLPHPAYCDPFLLFTCMCVWLNDVCKRSLWMVILHSNVVDIKQGLGGEGKGGEIGGHLWYSQQLKKKNIHFKDKFGKAHSNVGHFQW